MSIAKLPQSLPYKIYTPGENLSGGLDCLPDLLGICSGDVGSVGGVVEAILGKLEPTSVDHSKSVGSSSRKRYFIWFKCLLITLPTSSLTK